MITRDQCKTPCLRAIAKKLRKSQQFLLACTLLSCLWACKKDESTESANETQFSAITDRASQHYLKNFYAALARTQSAELCIGLVGFEPGSERAKNYAVFALRSLRRWLNEVRNSPAWAGKSVPAINHKEQSGPCSMSDSLDGTSFSVTFFSTQSHWVSNMCGSASPYLYPLDKSMLCRQNSGYSIGTPGIPAVYLSPLIGSRERHPIMEASVMHEFGHSFGLGDTYNALGVTYQGSMGDSLMKYSGGVELYPDDQAGLATAISIASGKEAGCDGQVLQGSPGYLFCNPSKDFLSTLRNTHQKIEERVEENAPAPRQTNQPSSEGSNTDSYRAVIEFNQDTWLKSDPTQQGNDLPSEQRCRMPARSAITVRIFPKLGKLNHAFYRAEKKLEVCNEKVGTEGYFFIPHLLNETKLQ